MDTLVVSLLLRVQSAGILLLSFFSSSFVFPGLSLRFGLSFSATRISLIASPLLIIPSHPSRLHKHTTFCQISILQ